MTPEAQRICIAEACGWKQYHEKGNTPWADNPEFYSPEGKFSLLVDLPDYINDLNAMHEAENTLQDYPLFVAHLVTVLKPGEYAVKATAAQRAEAFLRTLNLWKD